jgi:hypothetical protein
MSSFLSFSQSTCLLICYMIDFGPLDVGIGSDCIAARFTAEKIHHSLLLSSAAQKIHCCYRRLY